MTYIIILYFIYVQLSQEKGLPEYIIAADDQMDLS